MTPTTRLLAWFATQTRLVRYFTFAILLHALIILLAGTIRLVQMLPPPEISGGVSGLTPAPEAPPDLNEAAPPALGSNLSPSPAPPASTHVQPQAISNPSPLPVFGVEGNEGRSDLFRLPANVSASPVTKLSMNSGGIPWGNPGGSANSFIQRIDGASRGKWLNAGGGTDADEKAVLAALRWLKEHQAPNGSWNGNDALSALATLCFLGHGETPDSEEFGSTVSKAFGFLVTVVGTEGMVKSKNMYAQGAVTLALSEAFGMTQSPQVREPLDRAVSAILQSQKVKKTQEIHVGGWRYSPASADADTSVTGWLVMGLKSAKLAGISVPDEAFEMASQYLWNMYSEGGGFGYAGPGHGQATTAVGVLCQQFLGHGSDKRLKKSLDFYKTQKVDWQEPSAKGFTLYGWYYATQAMFQGGGAYWEYWNKEMQQTLVKAQTTDGHWDLPGGSNEGAHGPVYSTTLCCLMLEVYYRYLPLYRENDHKALPALRTGAIERRAAISPPS